MHRREPDTDHCGASQALDLIVRTLLKPGDCVVVESPGYPMLFELLRLHGVRMHEVARTPRGPDIAALEALLQEHRPRGLFINSFHHNPTGCCLTPVVAQRLLQLAKTYGVQVIEDDVYADLHSGPGKRLAALDNSVIYVGSYPRHSAVPCVSASSRQVPRSLHDWPKSK